MRTRRVGAYGICRDADGRVLLARNSDLSTFPGLWTLPGGGVDHGEHPDDAVVREFAEETGLTVRVGGLHGVMSDVFELPGPGHLEHTDRLIYDVSVVGGTLRDEIGGTTDLVEWSEPGTHPLMPFTARALGMPVPDPALADYSDIPLQKVNRVQRFGAYAVATGPDGRVLLTRIAAGYPGAGLWHLPGGGTDHGESPENALARELAEETSQRGRITGLIGASHRYTPGALGPEGVPIDWHVIRVLFRVFVDLPTDPVVSEQAGGSTAEAGWFTPGQVQNMRLTEVAQSVVREWARAQVG